MISKITKLEAALYYSGRGWAVLPVYEPISGGKCSCGNPECPHPGKHPRTRHGVLDATTDEAQIREWWTKWPYANVAIATGSKSGVIVLDVDPKSGGDKSLAALEREHGKLHTMECLTGGGGRHLYFIAPNFPMRSPVGFRPGLDARCDGTYVLVPPSVHVSGNLYIWKK
ncbi:MAG: bifunctional DNA primase/polymerase [Elusimicrobiota bacterium]